MKKASADSTVEGAKVSVEKAKGNYERALALFKQKLISKEVFANLTADYASPKTRWRKANAAFRR